MANPTGIHGHIIMIALIISLAAISVGAVVVLMNAVRGARFPQSKKRYVLRFSKDKYLALGPVPASGLTTTSTVAVTLVESADAAAVFTWLPGTSTGRALPVLGGGSVDPSRRAAAGIWETTVDESPPLSLALDPKGALVVSATGASSVLVTDGSLPTGAAWLGFPRQFVAGSTVAPAFVQGTSALDSDELPTDAIEWVSAPSSPSSA